MKYKVCTRCKMEKEIGQFRLLVAAGRHHSWCKACESAAHKANNQNRGKVVYDPRRYAVKAIRNYVAKFGKDIIEEALQDE